MIVTSRVLLRLALFAMLPLICAGRVFAQDRALPVRFSDLGYTRDVVISGAQPQFDIAFPVYPQLREARLHIPIDFSSLVDPRSTLVVSVNGQPVSASTVRDLQTRHFVDLTAHFPHGARNASITIAGHFFRRDGCIELDPTALWMRIKDTGVLTLLVAPQSPAASVRDFLETYDARIIVVVPPALPESERLAAISLAYLLQQGTKWRRQTVELRPSLAGGGSHIVVGHFSKDLEVRNGALYVSAAALTALHSEVENLLVSRLVGTARLTSAPTAPPLGRTFEELGIETQTRSGDGEIPFPVQLRSGRIGGEPSRLRMHVVLTHT
ncbi:MAG: cellulose biosynthesis cyclic di-GMP-binding regulatory protein BcsB, partial [Candidatus Eremiobacteraeota bacterium]|nr:cellulose biosynthesis cyclic di-GMP-binding regulatory protein BcsB [Candidatus Eremiobacteraeota bacterium]